MKRFRGLLDRFRREDGFAIPTAMLMVLGASAVVTVGVISSVRVQHGATRDQGSKSGLAIAEAGVSQAMLHYNRIQATSNPCSPVTSAGPASGWCGPVTGSFDDGSFTYYVRPTAGMLEVVSTGNANGVTRRVYVAAHSSSGQQVFSDATVKTSDWINLNSDAEIRAGTATNGDINLESNARQCGNVSVGLGRHLTLTGNAKHYSDLGCAVQSSTVGEQPLSLPPVNQGDVVTNNDNARLFSQDLISGNPSKACWNGLKGNGTTGLCGPRHLDISSNTSVTLGGAKYSFCKLTMSSNTNLYIAAGHSVVVYFDSPESCGYSSGTTQMDLSSNARITSTTGGPANAAFLFVGSTSRRTRINLSSNTAIAGSCVQNFVVYAPLTDILLNSNSIYCGAVAGKTLQIDSNARIYTDTGAQDYTLADTAPHYTVDRFVECSAAPASQPSSGC